LLWRDVEFGGASQKLGLAHQRKTDCPVSHAATYLQEVGETARRLSPDNIEKLCEELVALRERNGRLFLLGVGGSAANCGHAVNDFRKLCGIEAYAPTDNVSELTARTNDEGWQTVFSEWLKVSRAGAQDAIFILSVGGGNVEKNVSANIVAAIIEAKKRGLRVLGIVGRDGGYTKRAGDAVVVVPTVEECRVTPHVEAFQTVVWHCLVSHPRLQLNATKW
jgi:D-sedoheptulose 7-phosphate isomerase